MNKRTEVLAQSTPWRSGIEFLIVKSEGGKSFVGSITMNEEKMGESVTPSFFLKIDEAQELMDSLWNCGLRPTEGTGSAGALSATQRHLEDMRTLVFRLMDGAK